MMTVGLAEGRKPSSVSLRHRPWPIELPRWVPSRKHVCLSLEACSATARPHLARRIVQIYWSHLAVAICWSHLAGRLGTQPFPNPLKAHQCQPVSKIPSFSTLTDLRVLTGVTEVCRLIISKNWVGIRVVWWLWDPYWVHHHKSFVQE